MRRLVEAVRDQILGAIRGEPNKPGQFIQAAAAAGGSCAPVAAEILPLISQPGSDAAHVALRAGDALLLDGLREVLLKGIGPPGSTMCLKP